MICRSISGGPQRYTTAGQTWHVRGAMPHPPPPAHNRCGVGCFPLGQRAEQPRGHTQRLWGGRSRQMGECMADHLLMLRDPWPQSPLSPTTLTGPDPPLPHQLPWAEGGKENRGTLAPKYATLRTDPTRILLQQKPPRGCLLWHQIPSCSPPAPDRGPGGQERHWGCAPEAPGEPGLRNGTNPCLGLWLASRAAGMRRFPDSSTFCGCRR